MYATYLEYGHLFDGIDRVCLTKWIDCCRHNHLVASVVVYKPNGDFRNSLRRQWIEYVLFCAANGQSFVVRVRISAVDSEISIRCPYLPTDICRSRLFEQKILTSANGRLNTCR